MIEIKINNEKLVKMINHNVVNARKLSNGYGRSSIAPNVSGLCEVGEFNPQKPIRIANVQ